MGELDAYKEEYDIMKDINFQEVVEEPKEEEIEETNDEGEESTEEITEEKEEPKKDKSRQIIDSERARRKRAEAELRQLKAKKEEDNRIASERQALIEKLTNGKSELNQDVAEDIVEVLGEDLIRQRIKTEEYEFKKKLLELQRDETFYDADEYEEEIRTFIKKTGVQDLETAYFAVAGKNKLNKSKKEIEAEIEQKLQAKKARANKAYVDDTTARADTREKYSEKEKAYAKILGLETKDVRARSEATSLEEILKL